VNEDKALDVLIVPAEYYWQGDKIKQGLLFWKYSFNLVRYLLRENFNLLHLSTIVFSFS
jgi:hypothetical protein